MDQFSHDLTVALEETSLMDRARVSRWGQRRRTRSTGNLPCAPQPTEDSSSSPTDNLPPTHTRNTNVDGLDPSVALPSDSDDKEELPRLPWKQLSSSLRLGGALESDSLNENFSPARFFKPNTRRKRKLKRMSMEYDFSAATAAVAATQNDLTESSPPLPAGAMALAMAATSPCTSSVASSSNTVIRKRGLKPDINSRSNLSFCGKRKRSNRDRYHDQDQFKVSSSMPRHNYMEEYRMRPRSYSSTSKPRSDRLLPLNKGLLSKIEKISQTQKTDDDTLIADDGTPQESAECAADEDLATAICNEAAAATALLPELSVNPQQQQEPQFQGHRKKSSRSHRRTQLKQLQFGSDPAGVPMDCSDLNDFLSSSSLSSSESDDANTTNDTDREGDDELTDWPGNEVLCGAPLDAKYDTKRKLTKKSNASAQLKSVAPVPDDAVTMTEDDTLMSGSEDWSPLRAAQDSPLETQQRYQPQSSEPITITGRSFALGRCAADANDDMSIPLKQIESEMSGETSNPFLSSPPCTQSEVREIRAGCRRIKGERPGFSIKTSVNERLARFLQDPRQVKIRLPDIEIYEHDSLLNLAKLYSLQMSLDNDCAVLTKTSNTTQSVAIEQQGLQSRLLLSDFKRRCYENKESFVPQK